MNLAQWENWADKMEAWADEMEALVATLAMQRNVLFVAFVACLIVGTILAWRKSQYVTVYEAPREDMIAYMTLVNALLARGAPLVDDLRRGVAVFSDVVLVSSAMTLRFETERMKVSDERLRSMIMEDVVRRNGVALRMVKTGEPAVTSLVRMDRSEIKSWLRTYDVPSV